MPEAPVKLPKIDPEKRGILATQSDNIMPDKQQQNSNMVQGTTLRKNSVSGSQMSIASSVTNSDVFTNPGPRLLQRRSSNASSIGTSSRRVSVIAGNPNPRRNFLQLSKMVGKTALLKKMFTRPKEDLETIEELPKNPRFCATLSPEAQFAMLKGYEDILIDNIVEKYPEHARELKRCTTPVKHIELNDNEGAENNKNKLAGLFGRANRISSSKSDSAAMVIKGRLPGLPSKKKQLVLTHRFNCAMDIIDTIKTNQGTMAISPRIVEKHIDPVTQYGCWSRVWTREFKL